LAPTECVQGAFEDPLSNHLERFEDDGFERNAVLRGRLFAPFQEIYS